VTLDRVFLLAALLAACTAAHAADSYLVPAGKQVAGQWQEEWSGAWWQWAGSFARAESPIADRTGELCASKQAGPVWFLAGTYGTRRTLRTCRVPRGKYLFFPLVNFVVMPTREESITCDKAKADAAQATDRASLLVLEIDGVRHSDLERHRQATRKCFDMGALAQTGVRIFPSAANGYYVMLKPLPPGQHVINFGGALPGILQAVTYTLIVE
jgi:hypothetical protein